MPEKQIAYTNVYQYEIHVFGLMRCYNKRLLPVLQEEGCEGCEQDEEVTWGRAQVPVLQVAHQQHQTEGP